MNRLLIGVVASTLLAGASASFADADAADLAAKPVMLQLNNGQQVKVMVPKTEASKLKDVKSGDKAIFMAVPAEPAEPAAPAYPQK